MMSPSTFHLKLATFHADSWESRVEPKLPVCGKETVLKEEIVTLYSPLSFKFKDLTALVELIEFIIYFEFQEVINKSIYKFLETIDVTNIEMIYDILNHTISISPALTSI